MVVHQVGHDEVAQHTTVAPLRQERMLGVVQDKTGGVGAVIAVWWHDAEEPVHQGAAHTPGPGVHQHVDGAVQHHRGARPWAADVGGARHLCVHVLVLEPDGVLVGGPQHVLDEPARQPGREVQTFMQGQLSERPDSGIRNVLAG
ncbi:hypothetical protein [Promicromonospora aerolata]|uniref:Uncharacterized protein n=1 Tax=Promicromonospora aerolata TaxID=195749 RepID=A0ABW4VER1_9MICO